MFKKTSTRAETLLDKTTRAAQEIIDDETELRATKTARLRKARLEREATAPATPPKAARTRKAATAGKAGKTGKTGTGS
ncbi:MAG: hypothetical protein CMP81_03450 [Fulvimarina sp.]|nr:hypothetical protein [Fulvimarina sp.]